MWPPFVAATFCHGRHLSSTSAFSKAADVGILPLHCIGKRSRLRLSIARCSERMLTCKCSRLRMLSLPQSETINSHSTWIKFWGAGHDYHGRILGAASDFEGLRISARGKTGRPTQDRRTRGARLVALLLLPVLRVGSYYALLEGQARPVDSSRSERCHRCAARPFAFTTTGFFAVWSALISHGQDVADV